MAAATLLESIQHVLLVCVLGVRHRVRRWGRLGIGGSESMAAATLLESIQHVLLVCVLGVRHGIRRWWSAWYRGLRVDGCSHTARVDSTRVH